MNFFRPVGSLIELRLFSGCATPKQTIHLTGTLQGLSTRTTKGTSDYILYAFQLIDVRTSAIVWEDSAEIKKQGLEDAAYR